LAEDLTVAKDKPTPQEARERNKCREPLIKNVETSQNFAPKKSSVLAAARAPRYLRAVFFDRGDGYELRT
jgi:hypothetical protein